MQDGCTVALHPSTATAVRLTQVANKWNYGSEGREEGRKQLRSASHFLPPFSLLALSFCSAVLSSAFASLGGGRDKTNCVIFVPPSHFSISGRSAHPRSRGSKGPGLLFLLVLLLLFHLLCRLPRPFSVHPNPFLPGLTPPGSFLLCHRPLSHSLFGRDREPSVMTLLFPQGEVDRTGVIRVTVGEKKSIIGELCAGV